MTNFHDIVEAVVTVHTRIHRFMKSFFFICKNRYIGTLRILFAYAPSHLHSVQNTTVYYINVYVNY